MPLVMNPEVSAKRQLLADLLLMGEAAALDVQAPNAEPLATVTISKAPIADLLAASDASHTAKEQVLYDAIMARAAETLTALLALPLMIEAP